MERERKKIKRNVVLFNSDKSSVLKHRQLSTKREEKKEEKNLGKEWRLVASPRTFGHTSSLETGSTERKHDSLFYHHYHHRESPIENRKKKFRFLSILFCSFSFLVFASCSRAESVTWCLRHFLSERRYRTGGKRRRRSEKRERDHRRLGSISSWRLWCSSTNKAIQSATKMARASTQPSERRRVEKLPDRRSGERMPWLDILSLAQSLVWAGKLTFLSFSFFSSRDLCALPPPYYLVDVWMKTWPRRSAIVTQSLPSRSSTI